jgi:hypothetical protein
LPATATADTVNDLGRTLQWVRARLADLETRTTIDAAAAQLEGRLCFRKSMNYMVRSAIRPNPNTIGETTFPWMIGSLGNKRTREFISSVVGIRGSAMRPQNGRQMASPYYFCSGAHDQKWLFSLLSAMWRAGDDEDENFCIIVKVD